MELTLNKLNQFMALPLIRMMATEYLNDGLEVMLSFSEKARTLTIESWTNLQQRASEMYHAMTFKRVFQSMCFLKEYAVSYTNQCTRITPYLCRILPSQLSSDVTSVQQMCAIVLVGGTVLSILLGVFFAAWCRYQNMINEFMNHSA